MNPLFRVGMVCLTGVLVVFSGCATNREAGGTAPEISGITHEIIEMTEPRPNRVHVVRVDLSQEQTALKVILSEDPDGDGPAEATLTSPLDMVGDDAACVFVNTNPWDGFPGEDGKPDRRWRVGQAVQVLGLAASGGQVRSPGEGYVAIWTDASGRVYLGVPPEDGSVVEGVAGFGDILIEGAITAPPGGPLHPRTALGVDQEGKTLWIVVVDGRQKGYSEGMALDELAGVMARLGCWHAANMDGGGSSVLGVVEPGSEPMVLNSPSDRNAAGQMSVRPLPMILTVQER